MYFIEIESFDNGNFYLAILDMIYKIDKMYIEIMLILSNSVMSILSE
jgi:hypothetical protein